MIERNLRRACDERYDVIVIGGGIYGCCVLLEAARRGLHAVLLERDDFGGATSWNSLRILHGGLRYLQHLDLVRFRQSVRERRWFCRHFPELVRPLPCLMPLYKRGLKRRSVMRVALRLNDLLSADRNHGATEAVHLPASRVLDPRQTIDRFPEVDQRGLEGAAVWHDALMISPQRILIQLLHWACSLGARALNYVQCNSLIAEAGRVIGVRAQDRVEGAELELRGPVVINCAGPWSRLLAGQLDRDVPRLFVPSLAFNVLLRRPLPADAALALQPDRPGAPVYFLLPTNGQTLAGTIHRLWDGPPDHPRPTAAQIQEFIDDLNRCVPQLNWRTDDIVRVYAGLLPAVAPGRSKLTRRPVLHDHGRRGGPRGLISLCGIKYTTARLVAEQAIRRIATRWKRLPYGPHTERPVAQPPVAWADPAALFATNDQQVAQQLVRWVHEESIVHLEDLLLRRTNWGEHPADAGDLGQRVADLLGAASGVLVGDPLEAGGPGEPAAGRKRRFCGSIALSNRPNNS